MSSTRRLIVLCAVALAMVVGLTAMLDRRSAPDAPAASAPAASAPTTTNAAATGASTAVASQPSVVDVTAPPAVDTDNCPESGHAAVVDRDRQLAWLCVDGNLTSTFPISTAWSMPDPGDYPVYAKDLNAASQFGGYASTMTHFVAFAYGKNTGARVAFHSVPIRTSNGEYVQPLDSLGNLERRGESSGCIRVHPDVAVQIWDHLAVGDTVRVIS